ncbi:molybdopterin-guanine dinucleotide biosynthesis protein B [Methanogenium cariaci]|jgi:molybdopterin synthase catalytic subunit
MRIIHVVGRSNSGKTTFIHSLIPLLKEHGKTAVIKHLHSHYFEQAPGKDTTTHYEHGADIVIGTDPEKAIAAIRNGSLHDMLNLLSDQGVEYTIIEGHKAESFQKVVIGDLEIEGCVLRNPRPEDVLTHISEFSEVYTLQGLVQELKRDHMSDDTGCIAAFNGIVRKVTGTEITETMDFTDTETIHTLSEDIRKGMEQIPGVLGVRFHHQTGIIPAGDDLTYIAVIARHRPEAFAALMQGIDRMKHELHDVGKTLEGEYHGNA